MGEHFEGPTYRTRRRKKLRIGRIFFLFTFMMMIMCGLFIYVQYNAGKKLAKGNEIDPGSFQGDLVDPKNPSVENFLLLGIDNDGTERSRTDTMMVLSWDKNNKTMKVISFMRDIYAQIPGYRSYKLNTAYYLGGVQTAKETITGMFQIPIHHYALIDFENFESIIDIAFPKGVKINVQKEMSEKIGVTLIPGEHQLNGKELLGYARFRADAEGDFGRVARQQEVIAALKDEALQPSMLLRAPKIAGALSGFVQTDMDKKEEVSKLVTLLMNRDTTIETMTVPIEGTYSFNQYQHAGSVIEIDLTKNQEAIHTFLQSKSER